MTLYNCKHATDAYRITKFTSDLEVEASYLCTVSTCECPAGHRPKCRHREMLPKFIQRGVVDANWFFDYDRGGWVEGWQEPSPEPNKDEFTYEEEFPIDSLVPAGLGQAIDPKSDLERWSDIISGRYAESIKEQPAPVPQPSPSPTIRRRV